MPRKVANKLLSNPHIKQNLQKAEETAKSLQRENPSLTSIRNLMKSEELRDIMDDILDLSNISKPQKKYLKAVFLEKKSKKKAIKEAFGRDLGYQEEAIAQGIMDHPAVQEFVELVKLFYVKVAPVAALKEVEMMLDPKTDDKVRAGVIKSIKATAGVGGDSVDKGDLPVRIVINMPQQHNTQVNVNGQKAEVKHE